MPHRAGHEETRPIVVVGWVDSGFSFAQPWTDQDELVGRAQEWDGYVTTAGYLMYEDERCVVISQSRDGGEGTEPGEPRWAGQMLISRQSIVAIEPLIPISASRTDTPPASAPATSSEGSPATADETTLPDAHPSDREFYSKRLNWCYIHTVYEPLQTWLEDHDGRIGALGAQGLAGAATEGF